MRFDVLTRLQDWFVSRCDGDWEHASRFQLTTLDNPGWSLSVNLDGTYRTPLAFARVVENRTDDDWYNCWLEGAAFNGACGPLNLDEMLDLFLSWVESYEAIEPKGPDEPNP
ncbi:MAG: immunity 53 family protein [Gemmatimonadota bacterium]